MEQYLSKGIGRSWHGGAEKTTTAKLSSLRAR